MRSHPHPSRRPVIYDRNATVVELRPVCTFAYCPPSGPLTEAAYRGQPTSAVRYSKALQGVFWAVVFGLVLFIAWEVVEIGADLVRAVVR